MLWLEDTGRQNDNEDPIDPFRCFVGLIWPVEIACRNFKLKGHEDEECSEFIAFVFTGGANKKQCGCLMKSWETGHSLSETDVCPNGIESASQVPSLHGEKAMKKKWNQWGSGRWCLLGMWQH